MRDKQKYNAYMADYMLKRYYRRREAAIEKLGGCCVDCKSTEDLEFDHEDQSLKSFNVATAFSSMSELKLDEEIKKCKLRCKKCHIEKSITEAGKTRWKHGTLSGYRYCKCESCSQANRDYQKQYYSRTTSSMG